MSRPVKAIDQQISCISRILHTAKRLARPKALDTVEGALVCESVVGLVCELVFSAIVCGQERIGLADRRPPSALNPPCVTELPLNLLHLHGISNVWGQPVRDWTERLSHGIPFCVTLAADRGAQTECLPPCSSASPERSLQCAEC